MSVEELQRCIEVLEFINETKFGNQCNALNVAIQLMQKEVNKNDNRTKTLKS